jgi:curved DNA-binding protein CbpA
VASRDHYEALGVPMGADPAEIRRAYLRLARRHHPDSHAGDGPAALAAAQRRMQEINAAWTVLGDPARRRHYDDTVRRGSAAAAPRPRPSAAPGGNDIPSPGWRPLTGDTAWMDDFEAWRDETDEPPPDRPPPSVARSSMTVLPVALFVAAIAVGCVGLVLQSRAMLAAAFVGVAISAALFVVLPMLEMRRRH